MHVTTITQANGKDPVSTLGFTDDQRKAYDDIISFINTPYSDNDYKRALIGPAGTGKTYLVKALIKNCNLSYSQIGLAAPTHKACRVLAESIGISNVKINTLQSDLGLRLNFDVEKFDITNPPFDPKGRIKIGEFKVYIVDEASMINRGLCTFLEKTCKSKKCKLIYIGDSSQLAPVNERYSPAFKAIKSNTLSQIVRQEDDNPIRHLLSLLRFDIEHKTFTFLQYISQNKECFDEYNTKGYKVCTNEEFGHIMAINFNDEELTRNVDFCKVIGYTNMCVSSWNKFIRNSIIEDAEKSIITKNDLIISYTTIVNQFNEVVIANSEEYILQDVVNYVHPTYELKGFLVRFIAIHGGKITTPLFVLDHKDQFTISKYVQISENMINAAKQAPIKFRAQKWREYYTFKEGCLLLTNIANNRGEILYSRDLDYGFALTAHKSQGSTFDTSLVDVNDIVYNKYGQPYTDAEEINRRLYVACSRCRNKLYLKFGN
jgi:GTPase SAR1 family protein